jgi:acetolactate synthase-1/2/3 large subunit
MLLVADVIAQALRKEGLDFLSCYPTTPMIDAAVRAGIRPVLCRQERVGVGIADGFSRVAGDGRFGAFAMQFGPGAENAFPGVASAYSDGIPILLLPLGNSLDRAQMGPLFDAPRAYGPVTRAFETIVRAEDAGEVMRRAVSALRNGVPGPVMVEIPADVAIAEVLDRAAPYRKVVAARSEADPADVERALSAVLRARAPVVLAGHGILQAGATDALIALAELLELPVVTTLAGKSAIPENHPLSVGVASAVASDPVIELLGNADLVLALGSSLTRHFLTAKLPDGATIVQLTRNALDLNKSYPVDYPLVGDARLVLEQLIECARDLERKPSPAPRELADRLESMKRAWLAKWEPKLTSDEVPITPYRVLHEFMKATDPDETIVTHDSGSPRDQIVPFYRSGGPGTYVGWGKSHALGSGLGLILGAKLAAPEKLCVHFLGDAAFGMTGLDLETAVRAEIPAVWVVLNNSTMAIEIPNLRESHEQYGARDIGGDYTGIAQSLGVDARRIERPCELAPAFAYAKRATSEGRCVLLEVITSAETAFANRGVLSA